MYKTPCIQKNLKHGNVTSILTGNCFSNYKEQTEEEELYACVT
jgi:hypothetical protein